MRSWIMFAVVAALACSGGMHTQAPVPTPAPPAPAPTVTTGRAGRGPETVTAADVRKRIYIVADDSLRGRATPSAGLETMAGYVASEFRRFGLRPMGDSGGFLPRYRVRINQGGGRGVCG